MIASSLRCRVSYRSLTRTNRPDISPAPALLITSHLTSSHLTRANKITSRSCSSTSYTKSQARVKFRVRLPALGRIQSQSRAFPFRPPARSFLATGELADWLQQSIAWRGLPDNFQRLAHRKSRCRLLLSCLTSSPRQPLSASPSTPRPALIVVCLLLFTRHKKT